MASPALELQLVVSGMHLSPLYGLTVNEIEADGFSISAKIDILLSSDTPEATAKTIGLGIVSFADYFSMNRPDILLILGDRTELLAPAIAALSLGIPIAHLCGGDNVARSITLDNSVRHALSKMAHIHLVAANEHATRLIKMGEEPGRVFVVGNPAVDYIARTSLLSRREVEDLFAVDLSKPILIVTQHPVASEYEDTERNIRELTCALVELGLQTIVTYPNSDHGSAIIIREIEKLNGLPNFRITKNLSQREYLSTLKYATALIGNTSSGIVEAPSFKLPFIHVGTRQLGRLRGCNVIDVGYSRSEIIQGVQRALTDQEFLHNLHNLQNCINPYGDGNASERIAEILATIRLGKELLEKSMTY